MMVSSKNPRFHSRLYNSISVGCVLAAMSLLVTPRAFAADEIDANFRHQRNFNAVQRVYKKGVPHTDKNGRRLAQYDPERSFFPIAMWGAPLHDGKTYDWAELKKAGFNTVWPWSVLGRGVVFRDAKKFDLQLVLMDELEDEYIKANKDNPHLLGNVWTDEPIGKLGQPGMGEMYKRFLNYKAKANKMAPNMLVFINDAPWISAPATSWWLKWNTAGDISCHDNYPVKAIRSSCRSIGADPNGIPQSVSLAVSANKERKPAWLIVGAFTHKIRSGDPFPFRFPTPDQLRAQVYSGLVNGATGIIYFIWDSYISRDGSVLGMSPNPQVSYAPFPKQPGHTNPTPASPMQLIQSKALWEATAQINKELAELTPALLSPTAGSNLKYSVDVAGKSETSTPIQCLLKRHPEGGYVLLTVNNDDAVLEVDFKFRKPIREAKLMFNTCLPHELSNKNKSFKQHYEPFATHVFRILIDE